MSCKRYKEALIEAATGEADLPLSLRAHVDACFACQTMLTEERRLLNAIDLGLRKVANAKVPASLLPVVRARVAEESALRGAWRLAWIAGPIVATIVVAVLVARHFPVNHNLSTPIILASRHQPHHIASIGDARLSQIVPKAAARLGALHGTKMNSPARQIVSDNNKLPEVLVQPDGEIALAKYIDALRQRRERFCVFLGAKEASTEIAALKIDRLEVTPLRKVEAAIASERTEEHE